MAVIYANPATNNKFGNKHLYVVRDAVSLLELVRIGREVFEARVRAYKLRGKKSRTARELKELYGSSTQVTRNTLLVLTSGGLQSLSAAITSNGYRSGWYPVKNGVLFNTDDQDMYEEGLVGQLKLGIRPVTGAPAGTYEVWHLDDARISALIGNGTELGYSQIKVKSALDSPSTLGLAYSPTNEELLAAIKSLKKVGPPTMNTTLPAVALGCPVDLSFLDE